MRTFVSCKTTSKSDKESIRIDTLKDRNNTRRISLIFQPIFTKIIFYKIHQFIFHRLTELPDLLIGYIVYFFPHLTVSLMCKKILSKFLDIELFPFGSCPSRKMHAISHIPHMKFFGRISFPNRLEHVLGNFSV